MLGLSIYLGKLGLSEQEQYLKTMSSAGFKSVFTSLHIPEDDPSQFKELLQSLGIQAKKYNMEVMADISPATLTNLGYSYETIPEINSWGVTGLRMDYGIPPEIIAELSNIMKISLNASTLEEAFIDRLVQYGINFSQTEAWHNFYPRPETGLEKISFIRRNNWLRDRGLTVQAFIPGNKVLRGPLFQGLPTLEDHRHLSPFSAYLDLKKTCFVDKILIGDLSITNATLSQFLASHKGLIPIRYSLFHTDGNTNTILQIEHRNRLDQARDVIRSEPARFAAMKKGLTFEPVNTVTRSKGSITIDNKHYGRYQGELQITLKDLEQDDKVNVIGRVINEDLPLLQYVSGGVRFQLIEI
ncbi:DUF871 domain-containing protein [Peribacillus cavernae]|uniref:DUF871 domain-containing protein n=1 Tax=Peribacillus cavernae TaxID=1674310 RepID=A0A433HQD6_9BACI|nr:MupG family TIM beta-alpha barrel fold protein [Peribacillus cavernae]MDQ0217091.1 hypothetical protein [Peribacillus cavernae]RUQ30432.1 DUF871 domain-containing protein [Peribacillus cavernae]